MSKHSATPWFAIKAKDGTGDIGIGSPDARNVIAECFAEINRNGLKETEVCEANAELMLRAVNSYAPLVKALEAAIKIADEAADEWDNAPSGMRAGKILNALSGRVPGYRADIDAIHAALKNVRAA